MVFRRSPERGDSEYWAPVADIMAALMLIFMFIAVVFVRTVVERESAYGEKCDLIYQDLKEEFGNDFARWGGELLNDLTIRFNRPGVLFDQEKDVIRHEFKTILRDFLPRYMRELRKAEFETDDDLRIREVRIEGHTSSEWKGAASVTEAYIRNMDLSQRRAKNILQFALELAEAEGADGYGQWARTRITALGLSSSRRILLAGGQEDKIRSRRVEFRSLATACERAGRYEAEANW